MEPILLSGCAIIQDGKMLVLFKRKQQNYFLPGGKVEYGESLEEAAIREVREEIGCTVTLGEKLDSFLFDINDKRYQSNIFAAEIIEGEPHVAEPEHFESMLWLPLDNHTEYVLSVPVQTFCDRCASGAYPTILQRSL